ncbi:MAG: zinc ABC transporter substrate-binding protein [Pseudomonadota bacterium]
MSIAPLAFVVERLAANQVEIAVLLPPGGSPHSFEPSLPQAQAMARAALRLRVGHPHLPFESAVFDRLAVDNPGAVDLRCIDAVEGDDEDPHVWLLPTSMQTCAARLLPQLQRLLPARVSELALSFETLSQDLEALDVELREELSPLPRKRFYVYHPAWSHLARFYGLTEVAIERDGKEPDPRYLSQVITQARADGARSLFVQPQFPRHSVELVAESLGAQVVVLDPMARDWMANLRRVSAALQQELQR